MRPQSACTARPTRTGKPLPARRPAWNTDTEVEAPTESSNSQTAYPSSNVVVALRQNAVGKNVGATKALNDDMSLADSIPPKWMPSRHHVAEMLIAIDVVTIGDLRRLLRTKPYDGIVDAILAADQACTSPGGVRDRADAKKCLQELEKLVSTATATRPQSSELRAPQSAIQSTEQRSGGLNSSNSAPHKDIAIKTLDDNAALVDSVPSRWMPSRHHVAELLIGARVFTVGDMRRLLRERPHDKIVDAILAADRMSTSPGGVRDRADAQKCFNDLQRLVSIVSSSRTARPTQELAFESHAHISNPRGDATSPLSCEGLHSAALGPDVAPQHSSTSPLQDSVQQDTQHRLPTYIVRPSPDLLGGGSDFETQAKEAMSEPQEPCPHCGRTFRLSVLEKHVTKCLTINRERKAFVAPVVSSEANKAKRQAAKVNAKGGYERPEEAARRSNWRQKSEAFRSAMKDARKVDQFVKEGRPLSELGPAMPTAPELDDRIQCPHCGRRFGEEQAARHIPICKGRTDRGRGRGRR